MGRTSNDNPTPAFILVETAYINLASVSYIEQNDQGNLIIVLDTIDEQGKAKTFAVTPPNAEAVKKFLEGYTVLEI